MKKEILFQLDIAWQLFEYHCHMMIIAIIAMFAAIAGPIATIWVSK